jgi:hypothetical protein
LFNRGHLRVGERVQICGSGILFGLLGPLGAGNVAPSGASARNSSTACKPCS